MKKTRAGASKIDKNLLQVRLTENEKRNIKMMAASQGLTHGCIYGLGGKAASAGGSREGGKSDWPTIERHGSNPRPFTTPPP